jgi:hypothetical protein
MPSQVNASHEPSAEWFDRWWPAAEFLPIVRAHNDPITSDEFVSRPEYRPLMEAYAAALFAWILGQDRPVHVRLERSRFPDFQLKLYTAVFDFELVEADKPGRRRTAEYKDAAQRERAGLPQTLEEFDPIEEQEAAIPAIVSAVERKAAKMYKPAPQLLVYVDFWLFKEPPLTPAQFEARLSKYRHSFPELWLLWGANAIRCWPDPIRLVGIPPGMAP